MGSATLPSTLEAQREIYAHQHPNNCSTARFLVFALHPNGIGAVLHAVGVALQIAMNYGRIFVEMPGTFLASQPPCDDNATLDSCYFLPFAGCRPTAAELARGTTVAWGVSLDKYGDDVRVLIIDDDVVGKFRGQVPRQFKARLAATAIDPAKHYYWWRAQSVAYLVRPRPEILAEIERRRRKTLAGPAPAPGCISVHVRHGDKGRESAIFDDEEYDDAASRLRALDPTRFTNQLFVSTEDPATIAYFVNKTEAVTGTTTEAVGAAARATNAAFAELQPQHTQPMQGGGDPESGGERPKWRTGYTAGVPRKPDPLKPNVVYMQQIGFYEEMLNSLLNLDLALECTAFVGSIFSNWVRLIDELRATIRCKADAVYEDVFCRDPHKMDLNW